MLELWPANTSAFDIRVSVPGLPLWQHYLASKADTAS